MNLLTKQASTCRNCTMICEFRLLCAENSALRAEITLYVQKSSVVCQKSVVYVQKSQENARKC